MIRHIGYHVVRAGDHDGRSALRRRSRGRSRAVFIHGAQAAHAGADFFDDPEP